MSRRLIAFALLIVLAIGVWVSAPYFSATAFVLDLSARHTWARRLLPVRTRAVTSRDLEIPSRQGPLAARLYEPSTASARSVIVFPGIHAGGLDEPRLVAFSRRLAATGARVLSVPLPELRRYRITPASTDAIEDAELWMTRDSTLAPDGTIRVAGVSFAGGLALVAAGRSSLSGKIASIVALGAHADLPRTMRYLCTGQLPEGGARPPHDYGVAVGLLLAVTRLVPADQVSPLEATVVAFLDASSETSSDQKKADAMFAEARRMAESLPEPAKTLATLVNNRDVTALGARLLPYVDEFGGNPALSPERSPATRAPTFLLHGSEDNVIPASEAPRLAAYLRSNGNPNVEWLLTPLISHATLKTPSAGDAWRLIRFWTEVLKGV